MAAPADVRPRNADSHVIVAAWQWDGCPNDRLPQASPRCSASPKSRAGIRCCGGRLERANCTSVCFSNCWMLGSQTSAPHAGWTIEGAAATLAEAHVECHARGLRLCKRHELNMCCKTGCRLDNARVWTADRCEQKGAIAEEPEEAPPASVACNRRLLHGFNQSASGVASSRASPWPPAPMAPCSKRWCGVNPRVQPLLATARPLRCGVLWFVHIGKTGGSTVDEFMKLASGHTKWDFVDFWGKAATPHWNQSSGFRRINQVLAQPEPRLAVHHHHGVPGLLAPELDVWLTDLRRRLQALGCALIVSTVLREPVSRAISHATYDRATPPQVCLHVEDTADTQWRSLLATWGCSHNAKACDKPGFHRGDDPAPSLPRRLELLAGALDGGLRLPRQQRADMFEMHKPRLLAETLDVVGATHELPRFLALLRRLMGFHDKVPIQINPTADCDKYKPSLEQLWWMRKHNQADANLYLAWCSEHCERPTHTSFAGWRELPGE